LLLVAADLQLLHLLLRQHLAASAAAVADAPDVSGPALSQAIRLLLLLQVPVPHQTSLGYAAAELHLAWTAFVAVSVLALTVQLLLRPALQLCWMPPAPGVQHPGCSFLVLESHTGRCAARWPRFLC
jgi:hypothetical protein